LTVPRDQLMEKIVALAKRRGFVYPSSEIYGGLAAFYDYGPYGTTLRRTIRQLWWRHMVELRDDVVGLESTIIMNPKVWEASGHVAGFSDPLVQCLGECKERWRLDLLTDQHRCPRCGGPLSEPRQFNLMFKTHVGPVEDSASVAYLRPETAQGMFVDFKNVVNSVRVRVPFGIAQQGRSFRNEITVQNFIFRVRELEQMEMEFFVRPGTDEGWHAYWIQERLRWFTEELGVTPARLRARAHQKDELSHYSKATSDIEYDFPFGWGELEGVANRTDFDLKAHQEHSGQDLTYLDPESNERYLPYVIEPALGVERTMIVLLLDAYDEEDVRGETRVVLRFHRQVAPVQVAVMPLSKKDELIAPAREVLGLLKPVYRTEYDQTGGNIGRRYRRQDEIGTPFCVTIDFETLEDRAVTIRERDSMAQERVPIAGLLERMGERFAEPASAPGE
jgi:glycyl-tRNA synthetase